MWWEFFFFGWQLIRQEEEFRGGKMVSLKLACSSWVQSWRQFGRGLETVAGGLTPNGGNLDGLESDSCEAAATALQGHPTIKRGPTHLLCWLLLLQLAKFWRRKFDFWNVIMFASLLLSSCVFEKIWVNIDISAFLIPSAFLVDVPFMPPWTITVAIR